MLSRYDKEINALSKKNIDVNMLNEAIANIKDKLPDSKVKRHEILKFAITNLLTNIRDKNYDTSFGMLRFVFFTNFEKPIVEARKQGVFRASKMNFNPKLIKELLAELYNSKNLLVEDLQYIRSVNGLLKITPDVLDFKNKILSAAKSRHNFINTILSIAETKYNDLLYCYDDRCEKPYADIIFYNNKESITSSASYIVQICREDSSDLCFKYNNDIDESINHGFYCNLLVKAFAIINYIESEIKVDFYDYDVFSDSAGENYYINNEQFETAKSYGYTKTKLRALSQKMIYSERAKSKSYYELLEEFWLKDSQEEESLIYSIINSPIEVISLELILAEYGHKSNIFSHDVIFKEEEIQILAFMDESYNVDVHNTRICRDFTCLDIFKLQRFFGFVAFMYKKIYDKLKEDKHPRVDFVRKRSVLPSWRKYDLVTIFQKTTGKSKLDCEYLLSKLSIDRITTDEVIDFQYTPILMIEHRCLVMPTVFASSNLCRSLALSENIHFSVYGKHDHMVNKVSDTLVRQGFVVQHDFRFGNDEIDIAAVLNDNLFLFECKNPYHPVNDFELRNTYAHIEKGFSQLAKFQKRFKDRQILDQFLRNLKVEPHTVNNIFYGVINANRALTGLVRNGIKVFHANEIINFISSGDIISAGEKFNCWKSELFHVDDLILYMNGGVITDDIVRHKLPIPFSVAFRSVSMNFINYHYDFKKINDLQKQKYRYVGLAYSNL